MAAMDALLARIGREVGVPELPAALSRLAPSDLTSTLLHAMRTHVAKRTPAALVRQHERDGTVRPAAIDARVLHRLDGVALDAAEGFEAVELAPVVPVGTNAVLGGVDQNNVLSTVRSTEVLADPTTALALECAVRRRRGASVVRLCAVARVLRMQPVPPVGGMTPHFRLLALVTAGRADLGHAFEVGAITSHVDVYRRLLGRLGVAPVDVELSDSRRPVGAPPTEAVSRLVAAVANASFDAHRTQGRHYYDGPMMQGSVVDGFGTRLAIVDGGLVPWTQLLLANRKERLFVSAIGLSLLAARWPDAVS
jgi:hypothetical protein